MVKLHTFQGNTCDFTVNSFKNVFISSLKHINDLIITLYKQKKKINFIYQGNMHS